MIQYVDKKKMHNYKIHRTHIAVHHKERNYKCDLCGEGFINHCYLKKHIKLKHENFRYYCDVCEFAGKSLAHLRDHKQVLYVSFIQNINV